MHASTVWMVRALAVLFAVVGLLGGCRPRARAVHLPPPETSSSVEPGDSFILKIVGEDKWPSEYTVAPDGTVEVPYIQRIRVAGLEPQEISALVRKRLVEEKILTNPSVIVNVAAYKSRLITVGGEVKNEGQFEYRPGMMLAEAIAEAKGMTSLANTYEVILVRTNKHSRRRVVVDYTAITRNEIPDVPLQAGDKITVPQRTF